MGRALSPLVGLLALTLVTLLIAAGVAAVVFSGGPSTSAYGVATSTQQTEAGTLRVTVDTFGSADFVVVEEANVPADETGYSATFASGASRNSVTIGDGIADQPVNEVNDPGPLEPGTTFRIVAVQDGNEEVVRTVTYRG